MNKKKEYLWLSFAIMRDKLLFEVYNGEYI